MEAWETAQYEFLEHQVQTVKTLYDGFLDAAADAGLDSDDTHDVIVAEGREIAGVALFPEDGEASYPAKQREILRIFETDDKNPWLKKD